MLASEASRAIGRSGQRYARRRTRGAVRILHRIADGVDFRVAGLQVSIDRDSAGRSDRQSRLLGEPHLRPHAQAQDHNSGLDLRAALQGDPDRSAGFILQHALDPVAQNQGDALTAEFLLQRLRHLGIQQRQHLGRQFRQGRLETTVHQLFHHFQPDETRSHDHRLFRTRGVQRGLDLVGVRHIAQREHVAGVGTFQRRDQGRGARREDQLVVSLRVGFTGDAIEHRHRLGVPVDTLHLLPGPHIQAKSASQELGRRHQELLPVSDFAAQVVGQSAIGERDVFVLLEEDDFRLFIHPPRTGRGRRSAGDAADDHDGARSWGHRVG